MKGFEELKSTSLHEAIITHCRRQTAERRLGPKPRDSLGILKDGLRPPFDNRQHQEDHPTPCHIDLVEEILVAVTSI